MALIHCSECSKEVSDKAPACPHCGNPLASPTTAKKLAGQYGCAPLLLFLLGLCLLLFFPIGTILGLLCWAAAMSASRKDGQNKCSRCLGVVGRKEPSCPHCRARFI
jgi:predicted amidophosphoribosyltransferase